MSNPRDDKPCPHVTLKRQNVGLQHWYACAECKQKFLEKEWDGKVEVVTPRDDERRKFETLVTQARVLWEAQKAHIADGELDDAWIADFAGTFAHTALARAEQAETPRDAEWIPVTERMPPHDKPVRFFNGMQGDAVCRNSKWFLLYGAEEMLELPNVTHWMPMPNIPSAAAPVEGRPAPTLEMDQSKLSGAFWVNSLAPEKE